jgi:hypothetical protein
MNHFNPINAEFGGGALAADSMRVAADNIRLATIEVPASVGLQMLLAFVKCNSQTDIAQAWYKKIEPASTAATPRVPGSPKRCRSNA